MVDNEEFLFPLFFYLFFSLASSRSSNAVILEINHLHSCAFHTRRNFYQLWWHYQISSELLSVRQVCHPNPLDWKMFLRLWGYDSPFRPSGCTKLLAGDGPVTSPLTGNHWEKKTKQEFHRCMAAILKKYVFKKESLRSRIKMCQASHWAVGGHVTPGSATGSSNQMQLRPVELLNLVAIWNSQSECGSKLADHGWLTKITGSYALRR